MIPPLANPAKAGSLQLPLLFLLALFVAIGFWVGRHSREAVVARKAVYAADAVATNGLLLLHPMEYTPPGLEVPLDPAAQLDILARVALVNGHFPELFEPLEEGDFSVSGVQFAVTLHPLAPGMTSFTGAWHGIPAARLGPGRVWTNELGLAVAATGVTPLGAQVGALPVNNPLPVELVLDGPGAPLSLLQWPGSDPDVTSHLLALGFTHGALPEGAPPPALEPGQLVQRLPPLPGPVAQLQARLIGRVLVLPLLQNDQVVDFARVRLLQVIPDAPPRLLVALAPSAVVRAALGPEEPRNLPAPGPGEVEAFGRVLRPWRSGA
jgi:hypothetical protein